MLDGASTANGNALAVPTVQRDELSRRRFLAAAGTAGAAAGMFALSRPNAAEAAACGEGCLNVKDYGAVGDGSTDDSGAFQEALDAAAKVGGGIVIVPKGEYQIDSPLIYEASNLEVACEPGVIIDFSNAPEGTTFLTVKGIITLSGEGVQALTADAVKGASSVSCSETGFNAGDHVMIFPAGALSYPSTALFAPNTAADGSIDQRLGEIGVVSSTASGSIQLRWPLLDGPYRTSNTAAISKLILRENIVWRGGEIIGGGSERNQNGLFFRLCHRVRVSEATFKSFATSTVELNSVLHGLVDGITVLGGESTEVFYGVSFTHSCQWCRALNSTFRDCRHALNCGGGAKIGEPGINRFITWANNHSYDATSSAFNSHDGVEHLTIIGNTAVDAAAYGIFLRSPSAVVQGNTIIRSQTGIWARNQSSRPTSYVIADNRIIEATGFGIAWNDDSASLLSGTSAGEAIDGVSITGNEISRCTSDGIKIQSEESWPLHDFTISGNVIRMPGGKGIAILHGVDGTISDNTLSSIPTTQNAIRLEESERIVVCGNRLTASPSATAYGVEGRNADDCAISGNLISGFPRGVSTYANCDRWMVVGNHLIGCEEEAHHLLGSSCMAAKNLGGQLMTVASAPTLALSGSENDVFPISGTTKIESITASWKGRIVTLKFLSSLTVVDGSNLKLAGNFNVTADDTLTLMCDGTNWQELSRSVN